MRWWILFLALLALGAPAAAQVEREVTAIGRADMGGRTPAEAREIAHREGKEKAVEQVCGTRLQVESFVRNQLLTGDFIHAISHGYLVHEQILRHGVKQFQRSPKEPLSLLYELELRGKVRCEKGLPDPAFRVEVSLNQKSFRPREEMVIRLKVSKESYLTVLNFAADNRVYVLFPNFYRRENRLPPGKVFELPSPEERAAGLRFRVGGLPGMRRLPEAILAIATRRDIKVLDRLEVKGAFPSFETPHVAATEVARWLATIPVAERAEMSESFVIVE